MRVREVALLAVWHAIVSRIVLVLMNYRISIISGNEYFICELL